MSFTQCKDVLTNRHPSIHLEGLSVGKVWVGSPNGEPYRFLLQPRRAKVLNSSCWKGFIAHYEIDAAGSLTLRKYVVDSTDQAVDEVLTGDFWLELDGNERLGCYATIQVPFKSGRIVADLMEWKGDQRLQNLVRLTSVRGAQTLGFGEIKWFGGVNGKTGRPNDFGFIATTGSDLYFHRTHTHSLTALEALTEGAEVVFERSTDRSGKPVATAVRVLSVISDADLVALIKPLDRLTARQTLLVTLHRGTLAPCECEVYAAMVVLADEDRSLLEKFWKSFPPRGPDDPFFKRAPASVKREASRRYYGDFLRTLAGVFEPLRKVQTEFSSTECYSELDEQDDRLATFWTNGKNLQDPVLAKMLSARAAEKVAAAFYRNVGLEVEDVSIRQLGNTTRDWITHDLLVGGRQSIDVKNARTPVNSNNFYVEHTVPKFKLDRQQEEVRIAGVLSPYLQLEHLRQPYGMHFRVNNIVYLGETSRADIDQLTSKFSAAGLEVARVNERTVPNWLFSYSALWCPEFLESIRKLAHEVAWPRDGDFLEEGDWNNLLTKEEALTFIPALYVSGKPLPDAITSKLTQHQNKFLEKLHSMGGSLLSLPTLFLAVLTDFLGQLRVAGTTYSPEDYVRLLYSDDPWLGSRKDATVSYPLGVIDPLSLIRGLIATLIKLWDGRDRFSLSELSSFRFSGLGILQGRPSDQARWVTLIAYCGGTVHETNDNGDVSLDRYGKPTGVKGKCGKSPLIIGIDVSCPSCRRLVCSVCAFCCLPCQEALFTGLAESYGLPREKSPRGFSRQYSGDQEGNFPDDLPPIEAYEPDFGPS